MSIFNLARVNDAIGDRSMKRERRYMNGLPLCVWRPDQPSLAIRMAQLAADTNDRELFENFIPRLEGMGVKYVEVGFLARDAAEVIDEKGVVIGPIEPGDSFVGRPLSAGGVS